MYPLPTHPTYSSDDPLGISDQENVTHGHVLQILLERTKAGMTDKPALALTHLVHLLEDIAYSVHRVGQLDASRLKDYFGKSVLDASESVAILNLVDSALHLSSLWPTGELVHVPDDAPLVTIDGDMANSLLAHMSLGSLFPASGTSWGPPSFLSWYSSTSASHPTAIDGYIQTLFNHFLQPYGPEESFSLSISQPLSFPDPSACCAVPRITIRTITKIQEPSSDKASLPIPFVLVAANQQPGPGSTGTHEERLHAASPVLALTSLFTPLIPEYGAIVTSPLPVHSKWQGHNRSAKLISIYSPTERPRRQYILADALPLDELVSSQDDGLIDLEADHVEREVKKLYAAFSGAVIERVDSDLPCMIEAPPWGCGAYGGNLIVKSLCIAIAAGLAGPDLQVHISVPEERKADAQVVERFFREKYTVKDIWNILRNDRARHIRDPQQLMQPFV